MWSGTATKAASGAFGPVTYRAIYFGYLIAVVAAGTTSNLVLSGNYPRGVPTSDRGVSTSNRLLHTK